MAKTVDMSLHYLRSIWMNLLRYRANSVINIFGLVIGFTAGLLIFLVISYEKSFDQFHPLKDRIYRVVRESKGEPKEYRSGVPYPVTPGLRANFPQIENAAAILADRNVQVIIPGPNEEARGKFQEQDGVFIAEQQVFNLFNFHIIQGDRTNPLRDPNTALICRSIATKYFGNWHQAVGRTIKAYGAEIRITGIFDDPPANTDIPLKIVVSYPTLRTDPSDWVSISDNNYCFILLRENEKPAHLASMLPAFLNKNTPGDQGYNLVLQPLSDMHYDTRFDNFSGRWFSHKLIGALSLIAVFLLIIACMNFVNLATANSVNRSKEIGVRKVSGASRVQLVMQFFGETGMLTCTAMCIAIGLTAICIPSLNTLLDIQLPTTTLFRLPTMLTIAGTLILVTTMSGFYPALVMARFRPIQALRNKAKNEPLKGVNVRRGLVIFQFAVAQLLVIGTVVVAAQTDYFSSVNMGFSRDAVVTARFPSDSARLLKLDLLHNELRQQRGINAVSVSAFSPADGGGWATDFRYQKNMSPKADLIVNVKPADPEYFDLYHLQLVAGRRYFASDTIREFIVNETLVKDLGMTPEQILGMRVRVAGRLAPIVGVVKDYYIHSLRDPMEPVVMFTLRQSYHMVNIRIDPAQTRQVISGLENIWNSVYPDYVFSYEFLDQSIGNFYKQERQLSQLYKIAAGIAIVISCLGLYGLIGFMAARKRREIGIRKVLGASVSRIVVQLSVEFTALVSAAFLVAAPVAAILSHRWLEQYTSRIEVTALFFIAPLVGSLIISWLTVGNTAIRAALLNPVKSLRAD